MFLSRFILILILGLAFWGLPTKTWAVALANPDQTPATDSATSADNSSSNAASTDQNSTQTPAASTTSDNSGNSGNSNNVATKTSQTDQKNTTVGYILGGIGLLFLVLLGFLIYQKKRK